MAVQHLDAPRLEIHLDLHGDRAFVPVDRCHSLPRFGVEGRHAPFALKDAFRFDAGEPRRAQQRGVADGALGHSSGRGHAIGEREVVAGDL
jgi:hypothetical protein